MKMYELNKDFEPDHTGLVAGFYLRQEIGLDEMLLLNLLEKDIFEIVDIPMNCLLIAENGFEKTIKFPDFKHVISIANYGRTNLGHFTINESSYNYKDFEQVKGKTDFRFKEKVFAKNKFIYEQM